MTNIEFWNDVITEKSRNILNKIKKEFDFILIGGWAVYLWSKTLKSRDIDMIVDFKNLDYLKQNYNLKKNDNLKKYEIDMDGIDIDIYVSYYSKLPIPVEDIKNYTTIIEGFKVVKLEALIILKQKAEIERGTLEKGLKDKIDILNLIIKNKIDFFLYFRLLKKYNLEHFLNELIRIINTFKDVKYLNLTPREFKLKKLELLHILKMLR